MQKGPLCLYLKGRPGLALEHAIMPKPAAKKQATAKRGSIHSSFGEMVQSQILSSSIQPINAISCVEVNKTQRNIVKRHTNCVGKREVLKSTRNPNILDTSTKVDVLLNYPTMDK